MVYPAFVGLPVVAIALVQHARPSFSSFALSPTTHDSLPPAKTDDYHKTLYRLCFGEASTVERAGLRRYGIYASRTHDSTSTAEWSDGMCLCLVGCGRKRRRRRLPPSLLLYDTATRRKPTSLGALLGILHSSPPFPFLLALDIID